MKKNTKKIAILIILGILILIQFFRMDKSVPETDPSSDFFVVANPPRRVITQIRTSCYDCHSFKTRYPWYSNFAPVSWMLDAHIKSGREHLNFSDYGNYSRDESIQILKNIKETIEKNEMPLRSYTLIHRDARISPEMKERIFRWITEGKNDIELP